MPVKRWSPSTPASSSTCIFSTYCPTQDLVIGLALEYKYIVAEQCCPTPTQGYPAGMNLEITEDIAGDYDAINAMISEVAAEHGVTGRLSTWPPGLFPWVHSSPSSLPRLLSAP